MSRYLILVLAGAGVSVVQLLVKHRFNIAHGEMPWGGAALGDFLLSAMRDPWLWLAGALLVSSAGLWYFSVSRIPLGVAILFASLTYPMVLAGSGLFLGEAIGLPQIIGCLLILCGIMLIAAYA